MTKLKTAILWGQDNLLTQSMEIFLSNRDAWDVIRISAQSGIHWLVEEVQRTKPDFVILCQEKFCENSDPLVKMIQDQPELLVLADQAESKVLMISLENNLIQVYTKHSVAVRNVSDLMAVIENGSFSGDPIGKEVDDGGKNN